MALVPAPFAGPNQSVQSLQQKVSVFEKVKILMIDH
jgi:hypothetical protein